MIDLNNFHEHIQALSAHDWDSLFSLLPEIEQTKNFTEPIVHKEAGEGILILPAYSDAEIVSKFMDVVFRLELSPVFDWTSWEEGRQMLSVPNPGFDELDIVTLCKLFTVIIRQNRFFEGFLAFNFENGNIQAIIRSLQKQVQV
ncbi:hypothetical protein C7N43_21810 [Sphingobacteriales bacterium UPWRP_1]|nr:hypothetical protein C7N43_21810 [Sphingobacteriales bacterium UPWRP_1]